MNINVMFFSVVYTHKRLCAALLMGIFVYLKALLQSSASRKTQKKKKKKVITWQPVGTKQPLMYIFYFSALILFFSLVFLGLKDCWECNRTDDGDGSCRIDSDKQRETWRPKELTSWFLLSRLSEAPVDISSVNTSECDISLGWCCF